MKLKELRVKLNKDVEHPMLPTHLKTGSIGYIIEISWFAPTVKLATVQFDGWGDPWVMFLDDLDLLPFEAKS